MAHISFKGNFTLLTLFPLFECRVISRDICLTKGDFLLSKSRTKVTQEFLVRVFNLGQSVHLSSGDWKSHILQAPLGKILAVTRCLS